MHVKDIQLHYTLGKRKLKLQSDITTQLLERLKLKRLTIPSVGKDVGEMLSSYIDDENVKWYNHFGKHFGSVLKS